LIWNFHKLTKIVHTVSNQALLKPVNSLSFPGEMNLKTTSSTNRQVSIFEYIFSQARQRYTLLLGHFFQVFCLKF